MTARTYERAALAALSLLLASCTGAGAKAEKVYEGATTTGAGVEEICERAKAVVDGYLEDGDTEKATTWRQKAESDCLGVIAQRIERGY